MDNHIIHGEATATLGTLDTGSVDLAVTDPPYLCGYRDRSGRSLVNDQNPGGVLPVFPELYRILKPDSYCLLFCGWNAIAAFSHAWHAAGFRVGGHIIWTKGYASSARHVQHRHESTWILTKGNPQPPERPLADVQEWVYSGNGAHPTEKALGVIAPLVRVFSRPGDLVIDPFAGSGTTAVAAAMNHRRYIGVEIEAQHCAQAQRRLEGVARYHAAASLGRALVSYSSS